MDLATAADVRISADLDLDAAVAQRLLDQDLAYPARHRCPDRGVAMAAAEVFASGSAFGVVLQPRRRRRTG